MRLLGLLPVALAIGIAACSGSSRGEGATVAEDSAGPGGDTLLYSAEKSDTLLYSDVESVGGIDYLLLRPRGDRTYVALADSVIPELGDSSVLLCVAGAFTGELLDEFRSTNIAGDYVIAGRRRRGYRCRVNTGVLYSDTTGRVRIVPTADSRRCYDEAEKRGGWVMQQVMLLDGGKDVYTGRPIKRTTKNVYRAACVMDDGGFAVIQSTDRVSLQAFIDALRQLQVSSALYVDMGTGWNYGWYRHSPQTPPQRLFLIRNPHQTNWIIVKPK